MIKYWVLLGISITLEVVATSLLKLSDGFAKPLYAVGSLVLFGVLFYLLAIVFRHIPMGIAYAIWSGAGIVLISAIAFFLWDKSLICQQSSA
nr:SMR family transporter [uncultured Campylobacter sp.]